MYFHNCGRQTKAALSSLSYQNANHNNRQSAVEADPGEGLTGVCTPTMREVENAGNVIQILYFTMQFSQLPSVTHPLTPM